MDRFLLDKILHALVTVECALLLKWKIFQIHKYMINKSSSGMERTESLTL